MRISSNRQNAQPHKSNSPPGDDLLWGAAAIADYCGLNLRQTFYKLERGDLPAGKSGSTWVASKTRLAEHFSKVTGNRSL